MNDSKKDQVEFQTIYIDQISAHLKKVKKEAVRLIEDPSTSAKTRMKRAEAYMELGKIAMLAGRLDMYDWKTKTIIDLKTTKFVRWQIKQGFLPKPETYFATTVL